jgi:hypothetical protein
MTDIKDLTIPRKQYAAARDGGYLRFLTHAEPINWEAEGLDNPTERIAYIVGGIHEGHEYSTESPVPVGWVVKYSNDSSTCYCAYPTEDEATAAAGYMENVNDLKWICVAISVEPYYTPEPPHQHPS